MVNEKKVKYSQVESEEVNPLEVEMNPQDYLLFDLRNQTICTKCQKPLTWYKSTKCITLRCGCRCTIFYPKNQTGLRLSTWIDAKDYKKGLNHDTQ